MALLIYVKMQSQKTNDKMHPLKTENVHSLPNKKNQDRSELILIEIQSFQTEKVLNGGPYH